MKCKKCHGRGKTTEYDGLRKFWCDYKCEVCNGTGFVDMTNEEWFCQLSTEEKAKIMIRLVNNLEKRELIAEWLKEKHNEV